MRIGGLGGAAQSLTPTLVAGKCQVRIPEFKEVAGDLSYCINLLACSHSTNAADASYLSPTHLRGYPHLTFLFEEDCEVSLAHCRGARGSRSFR